MTPKRCLYIRAIGGAPIWLHIDTDVVDPRYLPAEYRIEQGMRPSALSALLRDIIRTSKIVGFELTEFEAPKNPKHSFRAVRTVMRMIAPVLATASQARSKNKTPHAEERAKREVMWGSVRLTLPGARGAEKSIQRMAGRKAFLNFELKDR